MMTRDPAPVSPAQPWGLLADPAFHAAQAGVFDGPIRFANSRAEIARFPFPFNEDRYQSHLGIEAHDRRGDTAAFHSLFDIDGHYHAMVAARAATLRRDPSRFQSLPHMDEAQWEAMLFIMEALAEDFPDAFALEGQGMARVWTNRLLKIRHGFRLGEADSLPDAPLAYIGRQMQGDLVLLHPREGRLFMDAALVTEAFHWSVDFIFGLDWMAIHGPVQGAPERAAIEAGQRLANRLQPGRALRRVNWGTQTRARLDMSMENRSATFGDRMGDLARDFFLRTEFQQLYRLPQTGAVLFCLRNYMISLQELAEVQDWAIRLYRVLRDFPQEMERAPALAYREEAVAWLSRFDDGRILARGRGTDLSGRVCA